MKEHSPCGHVILKEVPLKFNNEGNTSKKGKEEWQQEK
mgnify:CR=1 FL=1